MQRTVQKSRLQMRLGRWRLPITDSMLRLSMWRGVILRTMSMRFSQWLIGLIGINTLITCTSIRDERSARDGGGAGEGSGTGVGGSGGTELVIDAGDPILGYYYDGPSYDGDTSCKPDGSPYARRTCCEGAPCNGECELHNGTWQCNCYGVANGCAQFGLVCCKIGAGCTTEAACQGTTPP
jgi:hypothetical protein